MPESAKFRCNNCGRRFEVDVLTEGEKEEARNQRLPTTSVQCPECKRTDVRRGWE